MCVIKCSNNRFDLTQGIVMVPAGSPGAGTTPMPFAGQAYVRWTPSAQFELSNKLISFSKGDIYE